MNIKVLAAITIISFLGTIAIFVFTGGGSPQEPNDSTQLETSATPVPVDALPTLNA